MAKKKAKKVAKVAKKKSKPVAKKKTLAVPKGYHTVQAYLMVNDCVKALALYTKAFGGKVLSVMKEPSGKIMHSEIKIGDSIVMVTDEMEQSSHRSPTQLNGTSGGLMLYVDNVDKWFARATAAGCTVTMPVADMFWGDRYGQMKDPFGHTWAIATRKVDMTPKQMQKATDEFFKNMAQQGAQQQQAA